MADLVPPSRRSPQPLRSCLFSVAIIRSAEDRRWLPERNRFPSSSFVFHGLSGSDGVFAWKQGGKSGGVQRREGTENGCNTEDIRVRRLPGVAGSRKLYTAASTDPPTGITCSTRSSRAMGSPANERCIDQRGHHGVALHTWQPAAGNSVAGQQHTGRLCFDHPCEPVRCLDV